MPMYQRQGEVPKKRHTAFRKAGGALHYEEQMGRHGFSGPYSNLYHLRMPTSMSEVGAFRPMQLAAMEHSTHRPRHLLTAAMPASGDIWSGRVPLFFNDDVVMWKSHPQQESPAFHRNGHFDEVLFVQTGSGVLQTQFGRLEFSEGDYVVIPRGVIWALRFFGTSKPPHLLCIESRARVVTPRKYRNEHGQLQEHAPFCERDIRTPILEEPQDKTGNFTVRVRLDNGFQDYVYDHHPFDVVGWDGYHFPWAFNIRDFEPIVGSIHQPPPVHQTFEADGFVICSFVARPFDFHPNAIPAPYPHTNADSDEILFYSRGNFMSRKGISEESMTYHPMGLPHGPQPGRYEESIGKRQTDELAVMLDTFRPLKVAAATSALDDPAYALSWRT